MGKNKAAKPPEAASASGSQRRGWLGARQRRKICKWLLWLGLPLALAFAVAKTAAPLPEEAPTTQESGYATSATESSGIEEDKWATGEDGMPPVDTWAKPSDCLAWAGGGQCKANPQFMLTNCAFSCAKLDYARQRYFKRCPKPDNYTDALAPGEMRKTFDRILSDPAFAHLQPEEVCSDPPVILFHNFLSGAETDAFVRHGKGRYAESLGVGMTADGKMGDVRTEIRTSAHGWCQHAACLDDPHVQDVVARVADVTRIPSTNAEFAQLVYYHACPEPDDPKCAFYKRHNDYIDGDEHKLQGVRVYTLFTYLNDVPAGGATRFTDLPLGGLSALGRSLESDGKVTFQPQKGKAVLWPSVLNEAPHTKDDRTHHEALPVTAGEKYGANFWIHQHDFKGPHAKGCTAS